VVRSEGWDLHLKSENQNAEASADGDAWRFGRVSE
jgi:hypothetical protein